MLHRVVPSIQVAYFDDLKQLSSPPADYWTNHLAGLQSHVVMEPSSPWESNKIGAGPTPIETEEGWLIIYHGVDENLVYRAGESGIDYKPLTGAPFDGCEWRGAAGDGKGCYVVTAVEWSGRPELEKALP